MVKMSSTACVFSGKGLSEQLLVSLDKESHDVGSGGRDVALQILTIGRGWACHIQVLHEGFREQRLLADKAKEHVDGEDLLDTGRREQLSAHADDARGAERSGGLHGGHQLVAFFVKDCNHQVNVERADKLVGIGEHFWGPCRVLEREGKLDAAARTDGHGALGAAERILERTSRLCCQ